MARRKKAEPIVEVETQPEVEAQAEPIVEVETQPEVIDGDMYDMLFDDVPEISKSLTLKSLSVHLLDFGGVSIPAKGEVTLTEKQMSNEKAMRKIKHAIKINLIKEV